MYCVRISKTNAFARKRLCVCKIIFLTSSNILFLGDVLSRAYVMINTVPNKVEEVLEDVKEIEGVEEVYIIYGIYDIIADVRAENDNDLWAIVIKIRRLQQILTTITSQVAS